MQRRAEGTRTTHLDGTSIWKGAVAGAVGGLVASWAMNQLQDAQRSQPAEEPDDATVKVASAISATAFHHELTRFEKRIAGPAVHYAFGSAIGAAYGAIAEVAPRAATGAGLPFGATLWLGVDETAVPALGFSKGPAEFPPSVHASALAAHLVYGFTADVLRRAVRAVL